MPDTPNLGMKYLTLDQSLAEVTHNDALNFLDVLVQPTVLDQDSTPPVSPAEGDRYIVSATATGDWVGQEDNIAIYFGGWIFITPKEGWVMFDLTAQNHYTYDGSAWLLGTRIAVGTNSSRGSAGNAGRLIWNTDDADLNFDDGTNWREPGITWSVT